MTRLQFSYVSQMQWPLAYLHRPSCLCPQSTGSWSAGCSLVSCSGLVSVEGGKEAEEVVWSYVALWRAGFASQFPWQPLSYSIELWDGLCIWKQFPVVFQALSLFPFSCSFTVSSPSSSTVSVFWKAAAALHLQLAAALLNRNSICIWIGALVPCLNSPELQVWSWSQ